MYRELHVFAARSGLLEPIRPAVNTKQETTRYVHRSYWNRTQAIVDSLIYKFETQHLIFSRKFIRWFNWKSNTGWFDGEWKTFFKFFKMYQNFGMQQFTGRYVDSSLGFVFTIFFRVKPSNYFSQPSITFKHLSHLAFCRKSDYLRTLNKP